MTYIIAAIGILAIIAVWGVVLYIERRKQAEFVAMRCVGMSDNPTVRASRHVR